MKDKNYNDDGKWKILDSRYLSRRPWLTVRREILETPQGKKIPEYYVLEYPDWVNVIARTKDGEFIFVRQYRHGLGVTEYELCAGVCEKSDKSPLDAAKRELAEETGVVPDRDTMGVDFVGDFYSSEGMTDELAHIMVLHLGPFRREQRHFDADEHVESAWIPWSDLAATRITSSNSMIAIQHEALRRLIARNSDKDKPSLFS